MFLNSHMSILCFFNLQASCSLCIVNCLFLAKENFVGCFDCRCSFEAWYWDMYGSSRGKTDLSCLRFSQMMQMMLARKCFEDRDWCLLDSLQRKVFSSTFIKWFQTYTLLLLRSAKRFCLVKRWIAPFRREQVPCQDSSFFHGPSTNYWIWLIFRTHLNFGCQLRNFWNETVSPQSPMSSWSTLAKQVYRGSMEKGTKLYCLSLYVWKRATTSKVSLYLLVQPSCARYRT